MNCFTPQSKRGKYIEEENAPLYYPQPPYNPDFIIEDIENREYYISPWGVSYSVQYTVTSYEGEHRRDGRGRRSLYEGVNWMPVSEQV